MKLCPSGRGLHRGGRHVLKRFSGHYINTSAGVDGTKKGGNRKKGVEGPTGMSEWGYGRWVKQLAFQTDCVPVAYVAAIVRRCPNLHTLIIDNIHVWKEAKIHTFLFPAIPESLRRIEIRRRWSSGTVQKFATVLYKCPSVRAASLNCGFQDFGDNHNPLPPLQLTALSLTEFKPTNLAALKQWKLPSLTHLTLDGAAVQPELLSVVQHFGPQLLFLDIRPPSYPYDNGGLEKLYPVISNSCPRLRGFVLHFYHALPNGLRSRSITHLVLPTPFHSTNLNALMEKILTSDLPALACVRVSFNRHFLRGSFPPENSEKWEMECRVRGIRVKDADGVDLLEYR
jgi:hypothetical protein